MQDASTKHHPEKTSAPLATGDLAPLLPPARALLRRLKAALGLAAMVAPALG